MADATSIARQYIEAAPRRDFDTCRRLFHPQYSYTGGDGQRHDGPEAGIAVADMFTTAFPDISLDVRHIYDTGDAVIVEFVGTGTHQAALMGIPATGRKVSVPVCLVLEIRDGKIYAEREYMDMQHLMRQLGVEPAGA